MIARLRKIPLEVILFLIPFAVYWVTAPRTVTMEDSGLIIMYANHLGINHPSGYPLHTLLGKLFIVLLPGSVAFRVHLLSMIAACATIQFAFRINLLHGIDRKAAALSALMLAFAGTFWFQAQVAEIYMLTAALTAGSYYLALLLREEFRDRLWWLFCFVMGLSFTAHVGLAVFAAPALLFVLWPRRRESFLNLRKLMVGMAFGLLGLAPYLHLLIAPLYSGYLFLGPIESVAELFNYVNRNLPRTLESQLEFSPEQTLAFLKSHLLRISLETTPAGLLLALWGVVAGWRREERSLLYARLYLLLYTLIILLLWRFDFDYVREEIWRNFQLIPVFALSLFIAEGIHAVLAFVGDRSTEMETPAEGTARCPDTFLSPVAIFIFMLLLPVLILFHWSENFLRRDTFIDEHARLLLRAVPEGSLLIVDGNNEIGPVGYLNRVAGIRQDVMTVTQGGGGYPDKLFLGSSTPNDPMQRAIEATAYIGGFLGRGRRVFTTNQFYVFLGSPGLPYRVHDNGFLYEVLGGGEPHQPGDDVLADARTLMDRFSSGYFPSNFIGFRRRVLGRYCRLFAANGIQHAIMEEPECYLERALRRMEAGDSVAADGAFRIGLDRAHGFSRMKMAMYSNFFLQNRASLVQKKVREASGPDVQELAAGLKLVFEHWESWPSCKNPMAPTLASLQAWRFAGDPQRLRQKLTNCMRSYRPGARRLIFPE